MSATRHILRSRIEATGELMARAFTEDPIFQWLFDGAPEPSGSLAAFMRIVCERSILVGHAYELTEGAGAALWAPPDTQLFDEAAGMEVFGVMSEALGAERAAAALTAVARSHRFPSR